MNPIRWTFLLIFVLSFSLKAQFDTAVVKNFKGSYSDPSGSATAATWNVAGTNLSNASFKVSREESQLRLSYGSEELIIENIPLSLFERSKLTASGVYFNAASSRADFSLYSLNGLASGSSFKAGELKMSCSKRSSYKDELDKYLDACTTNSFMTLKNADISSSKMATALLKSLSPLLNELSVKSTTIIENVKLTITNKALSFSLKAVGFNVNGTGSIEFSKSSDRVVKLKIDRVRSGIFPVTGAVFNAIDGVNIPGVTVQRPYITIRF